MSVLPNVTDIWFKTDKDLEEIAGLLSLQDFEYDCENVWEWVLGDLDGEKIDICRDHTLPPLTTETVVFIFTNRSRKEFTEELSRKIIRKLKEANLTPIFMGTARIGKHDKWQLEIIKEIE